MLLQGFYPSKSINRTSRNSPFHWRNRTKSGGLMSGLHGGCGRISQQFFSQTPLTDTALCDQALSCKRITPLSFISRLHFWNHAFKFSTKKTNTFVFWYLSIACLSMRSSSIIVATIAAKVLSVAV